MLTRSILRTSALHALGLAPLAACEAPVANGDVSGSGIAPEIKTESCPSCGKPVPNPLTGYPTSENLGEVGVFDDPQNGIRGRSVYVMIGNTGTLNAFFTTLTDEYKVTSIEFDGSKPTVYATAASPTVTANVTAGDALWVNIQYTASFSDPDGAQNTELFLSNAGANALIPFTAALSFIYPGVAAFDVSAEPTCALYGTGSASDVIQLGAVSSRCQDQLVGVGGLPYNLFEFGFTVTNEGGTAGTFKMPSAGAGFTLYCPPYDPGQTVTVAAEQSVSVSCQARAVEPSNDIFFAESGLTFPISVATSTSTWNFAYPVEVVASPVSTGGGSGSGSGGGTPPASSCTQHGTTCSGTANDPCQAEGCMTACFVNDSPIAASCTPIPGTFCRLSEVGPLKPVSGYQCSAVCGLQVAVSCGGT